MKLNILKLYLKANRPLIAGVAILVLAASLFSQSVFPHSALAADAAFNNVSGDLKTLNVANRTTNTGWQDWSITANDSNSVAFKVYYHNTVAGTVAHNTRIRLTFPTGSQTSIGVNTSLSADNASTITDSVTINSSINQRLSIENSNIRWYANNQSVVATSISASSYGDGYVEVNIGDIQDCWPYQGYVTFIGHLTPDSTPSPSPTYSNLTIDKTVSNLNSGGYSYADGVNANGSDRLSWQIKVTNTGSSIANNVYVRDVLPPSMNYVTGSTRLDNAYTNDGLTSGGINIGSMYAGGTRTLTFETTLNVGGYYNYNQTLTNYGYVRGDNIGERSDTATVYLSSQQNYGVLNIAKTVANATTNQGSYLNSVSANPGEKVIFRVQISTPSNYYNNQQVTNARLWDTLPSGLTYVSGSAKLDGSPMSDSLISSGVNLGTLYGTQTRTITFEATVNYNTNNQTLTNYAYVSADNIGQQSASAQVTVGQTITTIVTGNISKRVENITAPNGSDISNTASIGDTLRYTLSYTNNINNNASLYNAQIIDFLPAYTEFLNATGNGYYNSSLTQVSWNLGTLAPGATGSVSYQVRVQNVPSNNYTISNNATVRADNLSMIYSNEVRTNVIVGVVKGVSVAAVTGSDNMSRNIAIALMSSLWCLFFLYLALEHSDFWRDARFKFAMWQIRRKEKLS